MHLFIPGVGTKFVISNNKREMQNYIQNAMKTVQI